MKNNIPEAVRLGEKLLSEHEDEYISKEMALAVRDYTMRHAASYKEAMKTTGPIDNTSLYRRIKSTHIEKAPLLLNLDDPAYNEFMKRNRKR